MFVHVFQGTYIAKRERASRERRLTQRLDILGYHERILASNTDEFHRQCRKLDGLTKGPRQEAILGRSTLVIGVGTKGQVLP